MTSEQSPESIELLWVCAACGDKTAGPFPHPARCRKKSCPDYRVYNTADGPKGYGGVLLALPRLTDTPLMAELRKPAPDHRYENDQQIVETWCNLAGRGIQLSTWELKWFVKLFQSQIAKLTTATVVFDNSDSYHGLDNHKEVFFYEQEFYVLSNFSAFIIEWNGEVFPTSEHAYHWSKFPNDPLKRAAIRVAKSAHDAFKMAERWKQYRCPDWDSIKVDTMRSILQAKVEQHEYVRRKLLETGNRRLIENSWRDDYWGWGPKRDGRNMLGELWMEIRHRLQLKQS